MTYQIEQSDTRIPQIEPGTSGYDWSKPWRSGFGEPLDDNDLVNRAYTYIALEMYAEDSMEAALVRTIQRLKVELKSCRNSVAKAADKNQISETRMI